MPARKSPNNSTSSGRPRRDHNQPHYECSDSSSESDNNHPSPSPSLNKDDDTDKTDPCYDSSSEMNNLSVFLNDTSLDSPSKRRNSSPGLPPSALHQSPGLQTRSDTPRRAPLSLLWLLVPAAIVCVSVLVLWLRIQSAPSHQLARPSLHETIRESKHALREAFPAQPNMTWAAFFAELRPLLQAEAPAPTRPAVVLLVGSEKNAATLSCLARRLRGLATALLGCPSCRALMPGSAPGVSEDAEKLAMDQEVKGAYESGDRCFHLTRLEDLSRQQLLLMHAWCDGDHSPFKKALFLLELRAREAESGERDVERSLLQQWNTKVGADEAGALNSRLANALIIVREEKDLAGGNSCVHPP